MQHFLLKTLHLDFERAELFIVSKIIHSLDDDIEFVTQQYVQRSDGKRALTDLFFPQFGVHLEIDEPPHERQAEKDKDRERDIIDVTGHEMQRIAVLDDRKSEKDLPALRIEIDRFTRYIQMKKSNAILNGTFQAWDFDGRYNPQQYIDSGFIDVAYNVVFRRQTEALRCFGFSGKGYQRGLWRIPDGTKDALWFPRLYPYGNWNNFLEEGGQVIFEKPITPEGFRSIKSQIEDFNAGKYRHYIVFAKAVDVLGGRLYRYVGTFEANLHASNEGCIRFDLVRSREPTRTYIGSK